MYFERFIHCSMGLYISIKKHKKTEFFSCFFLQIERGIKHSTVSMNFPFFMLMVGPSQTGKITCILNFIKYFSFINKGHISQNVLFLHMAKFGNMINLED